MEELVKKIEVLESQLSQLMQDQAAADAIAQAEAEESKKEFDAFIAERREYQRQQLESENKLKTMMI